jgi:hypothetical protein
MNPAICFGALIGGGFVALVLWCCLAMSKRQGQDQEY